MGTSSDRPYRVLSLDGGGMRGVYTAAFLERLCADQAKRRECGAVDLGLGFDLIVGTSTGAIVGSAAAIGCPMAKVTTLYRDHGSSIFPHRLKSKASAIGRAAMGRRHVRSGDRALRRALVEVLGSTTLGQVHRERHIAMSVPAVRMFNHRAWVFKKSPASGVRDDDYPLVDVCMASSAAPIYRSLAAIDTPGCAGGPQQVFADGGLWANNPIMVAMTDALAIAPHDRRIEIYSLGTCPRPEGEHISGQEVHRTMLEWWLGANVAPLSISAQEFAYDNMARLLAKQFSDLGREIETIRFPRKDVPASMMPFLALDDTRREAIDRLIEQANSDADMTRSACDDQNDPKGQRIRAMLDDLPSYDPPTGDLGREGPLRLVPKLKHRGRTMYDCNADIRAFHDQRVTLPEKERGKMRDRRNSNRSRLRKGLKKQGKPLPQESVSQGSYQMKTMLQDQNNDYDIDDGQYFDKGVLVGPRGAELTSLEARAMVRDAIDDGGFARPPEVRGNCVRVFYAVGYHVDLPVYRRVAEDGGETLHHELASSSGWRRSDARDVTSWYEDMRRATTDPRQFRRLNRHLKMQARSRSSWRPRTLSGFGISVMMTERGVVEVGREDRALHDSMVAIRDRLSMKLTIDHPVTPGETITSGGADAKAAHYRDRLTEAIDHLGPLFEPNCTRETALKCWDKVFNTTFFSERLEARSDLVRETKSGLAAPAIGSGTLLGATASTAAAVSDAGGGRHA